MIVGVGDGVVVGVGVGVAVGVLVGDGVGLGVSVGSGVGVAVGVATTVAVGVSVGVGSLPAEDLILTWGNEAGEAQWQADRMIFYHTNEISSVVSMTVTTTLEDCEVVNRSDNHDIEVVTREYWVYEARLQCASGAIQPSLWIDTYPRGKYTLTQTGDSWHICEWNLGPIETSTYWRCQE